MRMLLNSTTRAKKLAKLLRAASGLSLSVCQQQVARVCGYRDWHDLEEVARTQTGTAEQKVPVETEVDVIAALATGLQISAGDVQHAIATARLFGTSEPDLNHACEVRRRLLVAVDLPPSRRGEPGWVVETNVRGQKKEPAIIRSTDGATTLITRSSFSASRGDNEIKSPREPLPLFIPWRLYFPYGIWAERDGAKVVFSRDYCPMWRIRVGHTPERLHPWERIVHESTQYVSGDGPINWDDPELEANAIGLLKDLGVLSMPKLVDLLPLMIRKDCEVGGALAEAKVWHIKNLARVS